MTTGNANFAENTRASAPPGSADSNARLVTQFRKRALAKLTVGDGLDKTFGRGWRFLLVGGAGGRMRLIFARGPLLYPERAAFIFLDRRRRDALITMDEYPHHETIVARILEALSELEHRTG